MVMNVEIQLSNFDCAIPGSEYSSWYYPAYGTESQVGSGSGPMSGIFGGRWYCVSTKDIYGKRTVDGLLGRGAFTAEGQQGGVQR
jgi:hypothetical protein